MAQTTIKPVLELKSFDSSSDFFCIIPGGSVVKNLLAVQETWETQVRFLGWEDLLEKEMTTHSSILLPREVHGQKSLVGYST